MPGRDVLTRARALVTARGSARLPAARRLRCLRRGCLRRGCRRGVVAVQVIQPHDRDKVRAVLRIGRVDAGQVGREGVRKVPVGHGVLVARAGGQKLAVIGDALGHVVVHAKRRGERHPLAVLVFTRWLHVGASRPSALDAEQVVVPDRQHALTPSRFVDRLGNRHRGRDAIPALCGHGTRRHLADESLLGGGLQDLSRGRVVPGVRGRRRRGRTARRVIGHRLQARDRRRAGPLAVACPLAVPARWPLPALVPVPGRDAVAARDGVPPRPELPARPVLPPCPALAAPVEAPARARDAARAWDPVRAEFPCAVPARAISPPAPGMAMPAARHCP